MINRLCPKNSYCLKALVINYEKIPKYLFINRLFIISIFNSLAFNFLVRRFVKQSVNKSSLYQYPMPQSKEEEILTNPLYLTLKKYFFVNS